MVGISYREDILSVGMGVIELGPECEGCFGFKLVVGYLYMIIIENSIRGIIV